MIFLIWYLAQIRRIRNILKVETRGVKVSMDNSLLGYLIINSNVGVPNKDKLPLRILLALLWTSLLSNKQRFLATQTHPKSSISTKYHCKNYKLLSLVNALG